LGEDEDSMDKRRDPTSNGKRIEETTTGWRLINYQYYRDLAKQEERREQVRAAQARHRKKSNQKSSTIIIGNQESAPIIAGNTSEAYSHSEAESLSLNGDSSVTRNTTATSTSVPIAADADDGHAKKRRPKPSPVYESPPSFEEVKSYIEKKGLSHLVDAYEFLRKNSAIGWVDTRGRAYTNWHSVIATWADYAREKEEG
jgi:hypothetical protein